MDSMELERLLRAADIVEIEQLLSKYLQCLDSNNYMGIYDLFAKDHPEIAYEVVEGGAYEGPENVRIYMEEMNRLTADPRYMVGWMGLQYLLSPRIVLNEDATRAKAQFNQLSPHVMGVTPYPGDEYKTTQYWFIGKYDNEYIKINGEWKILKAHICAFARTPYDQGWVRQPDARRFFTPGKLPQKPGRYYTYHSDAIYSGNGFYNWGPFLPKDGEF